MPEIRVQCECGKGLRLSAEQAGRKGRCPQCGRTMVVPPAEEFARLAVRGRMSVGELETLGDAERTTTVQPVVSVGDRETSAPESERKVIDQQPPKPAARSSEAPGLWQPGSVVAGLYDVKRALGEGGFGTVWHVHHRQWKLDLAVKELRLDKADARRREQFLREANAWVELQMHPHIVTAWYVRELGGKHYLFLEYCEGGCVQDWIDDARTRDLQTALDIGIQLAWGLEHCHGQGVVHRDFKPLNVMMTTDGTAKITDFGMVKFVAADERESADGNQDALGGMRQTMGGKYRGTPPYMPPEQWAAAAEPRSDLYALGVTLFELLTGEFPIRPPGNDRSVAAWIAAHTQHAPAELKTLRADVPDALRALISQCLSKKAAERPSAAAEVAATLTSIYRSVTGGEYPRPKPENLQPLADALNNRGVSYFDLGRTADAESVLEQALAADPHHLEATYNLGLLQWRSGRVTDAGLIDQLEEVGVTHGEQWRHSYLLGLVHRERADGQEALRCLQEAEQGAGGDSLVQEALIEAQRELNTQSNLVRTVSPARADSLGVDRSGRLVVASGLTDQHVRLFDLKTGEEQRTLSGMSPVCLSGDGRVVVARGSQGLGDTTLQVLDAQTGQPLRSYIGHHSPITAVAISDEHQYAASGDLQGDIHVWDLKNSTEPVRIFKTLSGPVTSVSFSGDNRVVLSTTSDHNLGPNIAPPTAVKDQNTLRLWDVLGGECLVSHRAHDGFVSAAAFGRNGRCAILGGWDGSLSIWQPEEGAGRRWVQHTLFKAHGGKINAIALSSDNRYVLSGAVDNTLRLWDLKDHRSPRCVRTFEAHTSNAFGSGVRSIVLSRDDRFAVSGGGDASIRLWRLDLGAAGRVMAPFEMCRVASSAELTESADQYQRHLRAADECLNRGDSVGALASLTQARAEPGCERRPDVLDRWAKLYRRLPKRGLRGAWAAGKFARDAGKHDAVAVSADGRTVLSGDNDGKLRVWDTQTKQCVQTIAGRSVTCVRLSSDGRVVVAHNDGTLWFWEAATGKVLSQTPSEKLVYSVVVTPDRQFAIVGDREGAIQWRELASGRLLRTVQANHNRRTDPVVSLALSPDQRFLVSGTEFFLKVWDTATGRCLRTISAPNLEKVVLSHNGQVVLVGGTQMRTWSLANAAGHTIFPNHPLARAIALSGDGRFALAGGDDNAVRLWSVGSRQCLQTLQGHTGPVKCVGFSSDGRYGVSGSTNELLAWEFDWELLEKKPADWIDYAQPYLDAFLVQQTPFLARLPVGGICTESDLERALTRSGQPQFTEADLNRLFHTLECGGFGWLRREGVMAKLKEMAATWTGPPPLPIDAGGPADG